jgi:hypothetical protein
MPAARRRQRDAWARALGLGAAVLALGGGCYKPNILDGGFVCASSGQACPDGYQCGADMHCWLHPDTAAPPPPPPPQDTGMESMMTIDADADAGGGEPMCQPPPTLCADGPAAGDACSPACQKGCACGRCNVVAGKAACVAAGSIPEGGVCNAAADDCAPGYICRLEMCGNGLARCYRHCTSAAQCGGSSCTLAIYDSNNKPTGFSTCDVPKQDCNPLGGVASGCAPALSCYLTNANQTLCDCPRKAPAPGGNGDACTIYSDCSDGFICIQLNGQSSAHCHFVCEVGAAGSCPQSEPQCVPAGTNAKYGFCTAM